MGRGKMDGDWCVLRMGGGSTLPLSTSLSEAGFDVWTPVDVQVRRMPRSKERRETRIPALPTFLFAHVRHLSDLVVLSNSYMSRHRDFSVMRHHDGFVLIADRHLEGLREFERIAARRAMRNRPPPAFSPGDLVKLTEGGFAGLTGVVETQEGKFLMIGIPGFGYPIKIAPWHLSSVTVDSAQPQQGIAALAA